MSIAMIKYLIERRVNTFVERVLKRYMITYVQTVLVNLAPVLDLHFDPTVFK